jgi:S1-C subfamily serine protease
MGVRRAMVLALACGGVGMLGGALGACAGNEGRDRAAADGGAAAAAPAAVESAAHVVDGRTHVVANAPDDCPVCRLYESRRVSVVRIITSQGQGSGVVFEVSGAVVTNAHVVGDDPEVSIETSAGTLVRGTVEKKDTTLDLAVVRIAAPDVRWTAIEWSAAHDPVVGEMLYIIGHPLGLGWTVTQGIVSARRAAAETGSSDLIQTDAAISPGNSGGPVFDRDGHLVAIVRSKIVRADAGAIGFAIPARVVREYVDGVAAR